MVLTVTADNPDVTVEITVTGAAETDEQRDVLSRYATTIQTFVVKNQDYGSSFIRSAKVDSMLRYGEVRDDELFDLISEQILVRGFYDKLSRFHQIQIQDNGQQVSEPIQETLTDMGNYAIMLAAMADRYEGDD